ncbi:hypothetical protein Q4575_13515 [Psychrosphaera sp. 1_MG-2023]|uniref:tetratricopeptide repeat protein n=1 Tax=Psychrosphaera sp. 1_MG-2023 TaxID=3062643 RepID=UPI0026E167D0|nr:tetratricopeptide repeat protein [Psychrosphaera sp. 1_MG-2023]MDO6720431.1 hypothetical protein [Psychrosphaera sp. 1_MG-2023]
MKNWLSYSIIASSILLSTGLTDILPNIQVASAFAADKSTDSSVEKKRRRTPALGARVYSQLARAQELADKGNVAEGLEVLDQVKSKSSSLNSYEKAMMFNFYGFIYYNAERVDEALASFEQVVKQNPIPESLEKGTLFSLSQLAMASGKYDKTLQYLEQWEQVDGGKIPVKNYVLKAQATYQQKDYSAAAGHIDQAIELQVADGFLAEESWYVLQRAVYFELKQPAKVAAVLENMVRLFNKPEYWLQLGGMYGEIGEEGKQLAVLEAAFQQGYVTKRSDLRNLSQVYYLNGLPFKAAQVIEKGFELGALNKDDKTLSFLAQSYVGAKEYDKAVATYQTLADISDTGVASQQIAEIRLQQGRFEETVVAAKAAAKRGKLDNPGNLYLALGMANFNLKQFDQALQAFEQAKAYKNAKKMAQQWLKFVEREQNNARQLAASL